MTVKDTKDILRKLDIKPSRKQSQHFLVNDSMAEWQVGQADIREGEKVLEIGPGLGILTKHILATTNNLVTIEKDPRLAEYIEQEFGIEVVCGDVLDVDMPVFDKVISNLPYHISSEITAKLMGCPFQKGILMYQKEFARHLVAKPGSRDYSRLTVMRMYYSDAKVIKNVPKGMFFPVPKVDSSIVELVPHPSPFSLVDKVFYFDIVRLLFSHKNRKVRNALISEHRWFQLAKKEVAGWVDGLPHADERPVNLSPEKINQICSAISQNVGK